MGCTMAFPASDKLALHVVKKRWSNGRKRELSFTCAAVSKAPTPLVCEGMSPPWQIMHNWDTLRRLSALDLFPNRTNDTRIR